MPKIVDHTERRNELLDVVLKLVTESGLQGVTLRAVARASGWSTGVLTHYFEGRADMLLAALRRAASLARRGFAESTAENPDNGLAQLRAILARLLPTETNSSGLALKIIFQYFFADSLDDETVRAEVSGYLRNTCQDVAAAIVLAQQDGTIRADVDPNEVARDLVARVEGSGTLAILDRQILAEFEAKSPIDRWLEEYLVTTATGEFRS